MKTTSPEGTTYSVTRRWMPWRRRIASSDADIGPSGDSGSHWWHFDDFGDDPISAVIGIVLLLVLAVVALPAIFLAIGVALEVALLLILLPLAVLGRTLLGRPWEVEVRNTQTSDLVWPVVHTEPVKGWFASGTRIAEISEEIRLGTFAPRS